MSDISERMKKLRQEKHLKQQEVADFLGISQQSYSHYEQGKRELPLRHVAKIAELYNVSSDFLLGTSPNYSGMFDFNSCFEPDVSLRTMILTIMRLNKHARQQLFHFLLHLEAAQDKPDPPPKPTRYQTYNPAKRRE